MGREERLCRDRAVASPVTSYLALFLQNLSSLKAMPPFQSESGRYAGAFFWEREGLEAECRKAYEWLGNRSFERNDGILCR